MTTRDNENLLPSTEITGVYLLRTSESELWVGHNEDVEEVVSDVDTLHDPIRIKMDFQRVGVAAAGNLMLSFILPIPQIPAMKYFSEVVDVEWHPRGSLLFVKYLQCRDHIASKQLFEVKAALAEPPQNQVQQKAFSK